MTLRRPVRMATLLFACLAASAALALTPDELRRDALALEDDYSALERSIGACPDGSCREAPVLLAALDELGRELGELHAARAEQEPCSCDEVDALLDQLDATDAALRVEGGNWPEGD